MYPLQNFSDHAAGIMMLEPRHTAMTDDGQHRCNGQVPLHIRRALLCHGAEAVRHPPYLALLMCRSVTRNFTKAEGKANYKQRQQQRHQEIDSPPTCTYCTLLLPI